MAEIAQLAFNGAYLDGKARLRGLFSPNMGKGPAMRTPIFGKCRIVALQPVSCPHHAVPKLFVLLQSQLHYPGMNLLTVFILAALLPASFDGIPLFWLPML